MTDPTSSENSSIERRQSPLRRQQDSVNDYGIGFNQAPEYQPSAFTIKGGAPQNGEGPPVPHKEAGSVIRKPNGGSQAGSEKQKKRRSWFGLGKAN